MRRGGLACGRPISSQQDLCETIGRPFAHPHFDDRSHDRADHVFEKSVGVGLDEDLVVLTDNRKPLEMADGVVVVCEAAFEGGEVL